VYAELGSYVTITLLTALVASYIYGKLIDRHGGKWLLQFATLANSVVHIGRVFVGTAPGVVSTNVANELATTGYRMAFTKGSFDLADISGNRIAYLSLMQLAHNIGAGLASLALLGCVTLWGEGRGLQYFFLTAALLVLLVMSARFPLYKK
jgi:MFS family permease